MKRLDNSIEGWEGYTLLDSGEGRKLENIGGFITDRPDPQALWTKTNPSLWTTAQAQFLWADKGERWKIDKDVPDSWNITKGTIVLELSMKGFKHVGIFPEHSIQWDEIVVLGKKHAGLRMLNLFGYTGAASVAAALGGMQVTHVDASKQTIGIVKNNIALSKLPDTAVRTVCEDTLKYVKRLVQREEQFEVIVMDPPAFGRGPKGEVWKIEESLAELLSYLPKLLSKDAKLVILNGYASGYSARTFAELLGGVLKKGVLTYGDVGIHQERGDRILSTGIYAKWQDQ